ncbi:pilus assembly protein TadG-related protein [Vibrio sp. F74]|uniref:pilus assembly protein TadG-related protein n=1 Tax=Vibrio sp. F74 TaxID=700020 RepID=UPI0035F5D7A4
MMKVYRRQRGHAALLFVLIIPPLFGMFSLGTDGAMMMQNDARLNDALEAASLAVAAANDDNDENGDGIDDGEIGLGSQFNQNLASAYVTEYMHSMESISEVRVAKRECESIPDCVSGLENGEPRFFEFEVTATTKHKTIFDTDALSNNDYEVSSKGKTRKYQNHAVDIVFVSDFSGSMGDSWDGGAKTKYLDLVDVIDKVTVELAKFNGLINMDDNTVGYVGFNRYTRKFSSSTKLSKSQYIWFGNRERWITRGTTVIELCVFNQLYGSNWSKAVNNIFVEKSCNSTKKRLVLGKDYNSDGDDAYFYDVDLTSNFTAFNNTISSFYPDSGTSSYQGLIRGAQIAEKGDNPRRLIIVLSDGDDNSSSTTSSLVNAGMCSTIRNTLDAKVTSSGDDVTSKIAIIGFDYNVNANTALQTCAGAENVFEAENTNDILNKILELISEEIGHLK